jgi:hypothetical protein
MHPTYPSCATGLRSRETRSYGHRVKVMYRPLTGLPSLWARWWQVATLHIDSLPKIRLMAGRPQFARRQAYKGPAGVNQRYGSLWFRARSQQRDVR